MKKIITFIFLLILSSNVFAANFENQESNKLINDYRILTVPPDQSYNSLSASSLDASVRAKSIYNKALGYKEIAKLRRYVDILPQSEIPSRPVIISPGLIGGKPIPQAPGDMGDRDSRIWPVDPLFRIITSCYGPRTLKDNADWHDGIDFGIPIGSKIYAVNDAEVIFVCDKENMNTVSLTSAQRRELCSGYGMNILLKHPDNTFTRYNHLSRIDVKQDDVINKGSVIGLSGNTGYSTGPHLHFSIFLDASTNFAGDTGENSYDRDPLKYLPSLDNYQLSGTQNCLKSPTVVELQKNNAQITGGVRTSYDFNSDYYLTVDSGTNNDKDLDMIFINNAWSWKVEGDSSYLSVNLPDNPELDFPWYSPTKNPDDNQRILLKNLKDVNTVSEGLDIIVNFVKNKHRYGKVHISSKEDDLIIKTYGIQNNNLNPETILYDLSSTRPSADFSSKEETIAFIIVESKKRGIPSGLAIALGMQESKLEHIDPKTGKVKESWVGRAGGYGIFQIAESAHPEIKCDLSEIKCNIQSGLDILKGYYSTQTKHFYGCNNGNFKDVDKNYKGWERAVRSYNGWPSSYRCPISVSNNNRAGDPDYVSNVLMQYSKLPDEYKKDDNSFGFKP